MHNSQSAWKQNKLHMLRKFICLCYKHPSIFIIMLLMVILFLLTLISLSIGAISIPVSHVIQFLFGYNIENTFIIETYRAPRSILSILVGISLALSGTILQGVLRNPLASPDVIGITKGANLAACITIIVFPSSSVNALPIAAFFGSLLVTLLLFLFVYRRQVQPITLTLTGIACGAICDAGIQYLIFKHPININAALVWLTGSIWGRGWDEVEGIFPWLVVLVPLTLLCAPKLDVLSLGEDVATSLGEQVKKIRLLLVFLAAGLVAVAVAVVGAIGFVGLLAPHIARRLVGVQHRILLPSSGLIGAILVLCADMIGRTVMAPIELPAGLVTAIIGAPYFLYLLQRCVNKRCKS